MAKVNNIDDHGKLKREDILKQLKERRSDLIDQQIENRKEMKLVCDQIGEIENEIEEERKSDKPWLNQGIGRLK